jgi:hypothetical protein
MATLEPFTDRELRCEDCGQRYIWTATRQYECGLRGRFVPPSKCEPCRRARRVSVAKAAEVEALAVEFAMALASKNDAAERAQALADRDECQRDIAQLDAILEKYEATYGPSAGGMNE